MCGIVAAYGHFDPESGNQMLDASAHRGPDGQGSHTVGRAWLGHTRLAIVDVEGGAQPLSDSAGQTFLVGNGEIYNHAELRAQLPDVEWRTHSDNEVALHLFAREGVEGLARLRGMFALATADGHGGFVAVRDPLGIKPLYWAQRDETTLFASELKAFEPDWRPHVAEFPPGHVWTPTGGLEALYPPLEPPAAHVLAMGADEPPASVSEALRDTLVDAVERRMMADVPVGVFLSGGLDSSLVAAIAARAAARDGRRVQTFAVGIDGSADLAAARAVAETVGTDHHEDVYSTDEFVEALPEVVRCIESFDPMLVHSAVPNYLLSRFASRHVKVVLTGEGADELFAGYDHHRSIEPASKLHQTLVAEVEGLHNLNLQRCDRVSMAHGLEARVPFLDIDLVQLALSLPARWKQPTAQRPEKWLLRKAFDGWLPHDLLWRRKEQFGDGSGASSALRKAAEAWVPADLHRRVRDRAEPPLRSREETAYWRIFARHLHGVPVRDTIGRFAVA